MSREFGSYLPGYLYWQMELAADDCAGGRDEFTRLWQKFFHVLRDQMYEVCSSEAGDSGEAAPIKAARHCLPALRLELDNIGRYVAQFDGMTESEIYEVIDREEEDGDE